MVSIWEKKDRTWEIILITIRQHINYLGIRRIRMKELFHRTSVRKYLDKQVEDEKVEMMLKGAMAAPSAGNQQPWEFYVVKK